MKDLKLDEHTGLVLEVDPESRCAGDPDLF